MSGSVGTVKRGGEVIGFVRVYETPVPPVVHGKGISATREELDARWGESDWSPHVCPEPREVDALLDADGYGADEWPVRVCLGCRRVVDGFQPRERDDSEDGPFAPSDTEGR
jgi:hypothetical protein